MAKFALCLLSIALLISLGIPLFSLKPQFGIRMNTSASLPYHLFMSRKADPHSLKKGLIVSFHHPMGTLPLAKYVMGLPGDQVSIHSDRVLINDQDLGEVKTKSPSGKILTPIPTGTIPDGFLFMYADHDQSFDSRYADCGLIAIENVQDILWPIF